uniref:Exportin-4 n=1 Tax=Syphacia muris TaxID=451379 RepID=A0A0N5AE84_9BILA
MEGFGIVGDEVKRLEAAANVILAPPNEVSSERRREAEALFLTMKNNYVSPTICKYILETSQNSFVLFEVSQMMGNTIIKRWTTIEKSMLEETFKFLLKYSVERPNLPNFVRTEILHTVAKIFKRSIFDGKCGGPDLLCSITNQLFSSGDPKTQALGCELINAIATEFSTSWRGSNLGITWDFHFRAKKAFETNGLRQLFELSLETLSGIVNNDNLSNEYELNLCEKFLRLAESVLSWNFSSRFYPLRSSYFNELFALSTTFRPPKSWSSILQNREILAFFFKLHGLIRNHDSLCKTSVNVLVQLASLTGDVFNSANSTSSSACLPSVTALSSPDLGLQEDEIGGICLIIYKLFTYQKLAVLSNIDEQVLTAFLLYIVKFLEDFTPVALCRALQDDDYAFCEILQRVYEAWSVLIKASYRDQFQYPLYELTFRIFSSFVRNFLSPPIGCRKQFIDSGNDDAEQDDRVLFADIFTITSQFAVYCAQQFLPMIIGVFQQKSEEFVRIIDGDTDISIAVWQEDIHWLFLLIGYSFTEEDRDKVCLSVQSSHFPSKLIEYSLELASSSHYDASESYHYLAECLQNPRDLNNRLWKIHPLIQLTGLMLAWNALDHQILMEKGAEHISPEVSRSAIWCTKRLLSSLSSFSEMGDNPFVYVANDGGSNAEFSRFMIRFVLHRTFAILNKLSGEIKLCIDAVGLFVGFAETRPEEFASNELLYNCLSGIQLDRLPARRTLIAALVFIGVSVEDRDLQKLMEIKILKPIADKFYSLLTTSSHESDIADLLDCCCGVADLVTNCSANFRYRFLSPILIRCVDLISSKSQLLVNAVLELFEAVTLKLAVHIEDSENIISLYQMILALLKKYQEYQLEKYKVMIIDDEDKVSDINLFLEVLSNITSMNSIFKGSNNDQRVFDGGSRVAISGLEILAPLLEEKMLMFPSLCMKFYRFIMYISETPSQITELSETMIHSIIELLRMGLQSMFGQEIAGISITTVDHLATYCANNTDINSVVVKYLSSLLECTFSLCLEASCQQQLFGEATRGLYALICCNRQAFREFVQKLLLDEQNASARALLESLFNMLLPTEEIIPNRKQKQEFRDRFEKFLSSIQGLLVIT